MRLPLSMGCSDRATYLIVPTAATSPSPLNRQVLV